MFFSISIAMCESVSSISILQQCSVLKSPNPRFSRSNFFSNPRYGGSQVTSVCSGLNEEAQKIAPNSPNSLKFSRNSAADLGFKEVKKEPIELRTELEGNRGNEKSRRGNRTGDEYSELATSSAVNFLDIDDAREAKSGDDERHEAQVNELGLKLEELKQSNVGPVAARRRGRQLMKRSSLLAKQVISIQSALSLGFISQLWVDTVSWMVLVIEVRPNLLSGEIERFFLEDVNQVGDVVLIQDEGVIENDLQMVGLETLVGYNVITPSRQNIGKVRGYTFNINSGAVESLELDSFGISIIPSTLVSTYALLVEDVLEVESDTVVVHEAAALRVQRLTRGFWGSQKLGSSIDDPEDYPDLEGQPVKHNKGRSRRRNSGSQKFGPEKIADLDDWELPKDYL